DPQGCVHLIFFFAGGRRHTSSKRDLSSDVCSSDLDIIASTSNVSRYSIEHIGQQSRRKYGLLCFQRILHANNIASCIIGGKLPGVKNLCINKWARDNFRITCIRKRVTDGAAAFLRSAQTAATHGWNRQDGWDDIEAFETKDLFDQVDVFGNIGAPRWDGDLESLAIINWGDRASYFFQARKDRVIGVVHPGITRRFSSINGYYLRTWHSANQSTGIFDATAAITDQELTGQFQ